MPKRDLQKIGSFGYTFTVIMEEEKVRRSQGTRSNLASGEGGATAFWRSALLSGVNFFKASFNAAHVFSRHTHDEYAIAVIERGAPTFTCRGAARLAPPGSFLLINPDEPHEGRSENGRAYRMIYVEPNALARLLDEDSAGLRSNHLPLFRSPVVEDTGLAAEYLRMHRALETESLGTLEAESRMLAFLTVLVGRHANGNIVASDSRHTPLVRSIRQYLEAHFCEDPSLSDLSELTGVGRFALLRQFRREVGLPPHGYLTQLRLREARRQLLTGKSPALVAAEVGFVDQSHLIKRFRSAFGITPGQYVGAGTSLG
jgi:AraC-like DNA-binding protein/quercetin dioxygenase-like cupin family protein